MAPQLHRALIGLFCFFIIGGTSLRPERLQAEATQQQTALSSIRLVVVPRTSDRDDRVGKRTPKPIETKIDERTTAVELTRVDILDVFKDALDHKKAKEADSLWFVATGLEAARILNHYKEITAILNEAEIKSYKVFLLNPHSDLVDRDSLKGINDPHFTIGGALLNEPPQQDSGSSALDGYHQFVSNHTNPHDQAIQDWVSSKKMYKSDLDWAFLDQSERFRIARVMAGVLGPKSLPKINLPPTEGYPTKESILEEILKIRQYGPQKDLSDPEKPFGAERTQEEKDWNALYLITQEHPEGNHSKYFLGWTPEEIIAYQDWKSKYVVSITSPAITYASWGDMLIELSNRKEPLPDSYSNKELWQSKGVKALDQGRDPRCWAYARSTAMQLSMISSGFTNTAINHRANISQLERDYLDYMSRKGRHSPAQLTKSRLLGGWHRGGQIRKSGIEPALLDGIPMMNGAKFKPTQIIVRDILHFLIQPSAVPGWLKKSLERHSNETFMSGRRLHNDYEIVTGYRDQMMKQEISQGRPIMLGSPWFPITANSHLWGPKKWSTGENNEIVLGLASHKDNKTIDGHAVVAVGYKPDPLDRRKTLYRCVNSWGDYWGQDGYFWLSSDILDWLNNTTGLEIWSMEVL